jgi:hypothetical protein
VNWDDIRALADSGDVGTLGKAVRELTPARRKELAVELVEHERRHRAGDDRWRNLEMFAIAGAGLLPNASTLAPWLVRNRIWQRWDATEDAVAVVLDVLRHREVGWLPDLAARIAARMPTRDSRPDLFRLVVELCGDTPPDTDGFLIHLATLGPTEFRQGYEVLIGRMLEVVGVGSRLQRQEWPRFLLTRGDRGVLLDGCLARLQQGGAAGEMTGFLDLHEAIGPTVDETAAHVRDYVAMLPDSRSTVAGLAQAQLMWLDDARRLDFDLLCDASRWVFTRTEKKLVRAQLTWLGKHVAAHPDEVLLVTTTLFEHDAADLRGRAVSLVRKHLAEVGDATRAEITVLAEHLPADLAAQFDVTAAPEPHVGLAVFRPEPMPEPIGSLDELTREVLSAFGGTSGHLDAVMLERILEALVRFAWHDRQELADAVEPVFAKYPWLLCTAVYDRNYITREPRGEFGEVIRAAGTPPHPYGPLGEALATAREWRKQLARARAGGISEMLTVRLHEIAEGLVHSPRPALVSTPTDVSGLIDPATLVARLGRAESEGWQPWPKDLRMAFHRLPHDVDAEVAASLSGKAGRQLREWLARRTDPDVVVAERPYTMIVYSYGQNAVTEHRLFATVTPGLPDPERHWRGYDEWGPMIECWPAALPSQRDVVAAHLVPHLAHRMNSRGSDGPLLPLLAQADGPVGAGTHLALAYGLGAELPINRAYAVDALLTLATRGQLDGTALGKLTGDLVDRGDLVLNRVVPALRDAARSGAAQQVWELLTAALPRLWTHNRVADLVELAVELAQRLRPGGQVDGLVEVAARKGSSRAVTEAKRLVAALTG